MGSRLTLIFLKGIQMANSYMKRCVTHKSSRKCKSEPQWDITLYCYFPFLMIAKFWQGSRENGALAHSHVIHSMEVLKKLKIELPYYWAIPILGICMCECEVKSVCWRNICTAMCIAALLTKARKWKLPVHQFMDAWVKKAWYVHTTEYYSVINRWDRFTCNNIGRTNGHYVRWNKWHMERAPYSLTHVWST